MTNKTDEHPSAHFASVASPVAMGSIDSTMAALRRRSIVQLVSYVILLGLVSSHFALTYLMNTHQQFNLHDYLNGKAPQPYQYRALPAWILYLMSNNTLARLVSAHLPPPFSDP